VSSCCLSVLTLNTRCMWEVMFKFMSLIHSWTSLLIKFRIVLCLCVYSFFLSFFISIL
jgi:hypothetical protein